MRISRVRISEESNDERRETKKMATFGMRKRSEIVFGPSSKRHRCQLRTDFSRASSDGKKSIRLLYLLTLKLQN